MTSNPFISKLLADKAAVAKVPEGHRACSAREKGMFYSQQNIHLNARKIFHKPIPGNPVGEARWEKQSMETHKRVEDEGGAVLVLGMRGLRQGTEDFKKAFAAWKAFELELPTLADALGLKIESPDRFAPRASVQHRETNAELEQRLARQREEKRTGIKLEMPTHIRLGR